MARMPRASFAVFLFASLLPAQTLTGKLTDPAQVGVRALDDRTLPKADWTHHAHLRAGLWHVLEHGPFEAM